ESLTDVSVTSADDATLTLTGAAGVVAFAGLAEIVEITITVDGGSPETGTIVFSSEDLDGGSVNAAYSAASPSIGNLGQSDDADAADDLVAALNGSGNALTADSDYYSNVVTVEWDDVGERDDISA